MPYISEEDLFFLQKYAQLVSDPRSPKRALELISMSKKRKRDGTEVDINRARLYDALADEDEAVRIRAAHELLTQSCEYQESSEVIIEVLGRLFKGLCSPRKAARQGFAVALTEYLTGLADKAPHVGIGMPRVIDIYQDATDVPQGSVSGQEERDHYFGRLFGAEAIIKSKLLFDPLNLPLSRPLWQRVLDLICDAASRKPWLRQQCGWILYCFASAAEKPWELPMAQDIISTLDFKQLIRTPEGLAIWLIAKRSFPTASLSKHVWKHDHPLAQKSLKTLGDIMKDARSNSKEDELGSQGSTAWSARPHFVWDVVLDELLDIGYEERRQKHWIDFPQFWLQAVDVGLFARDVSTERKLWGLLVLHKALDKAPLNQLHHMLTENVILCLVDARSNQDNYLRKLSQDVLSNLQKRLSKSGNSDALKAIIQGTKSIDSTKLARSQVIVTILEFGNLDIACLLDSTLRALLETPDAGGTTKALQTQRYMLDLQHKICTTLLSKNSRSDERLPVRQVELTREMIKYWQNMARPTSPLHPNNKTFVKEKAAAVLEISLRNVEGPDLFIELLEFEGLEQWEKDEKVLDLISEAKRDSKQLKLWAAGAPQRGFTDVSISSARALAVLYSLILFEVKNGEAEAAEMLQELIEAKGADDGGAGGNGNALKVNPAIVVELLLTFASRRSKLMRTATLKIFEMMTPNITQDGIQSLVNVLATKESARGAQDMFDTVNDNDIGTDEDLDSDVEEVDGSGGRTDEDRESGSEESSAPGDEPDLEAFDAALASTLQTKKPTDAADTSSSDSDMGDDQMLTLDSKLAEVFKARKEAGNKKKEQKEAKDTVINFKNRVLDMINVYLKQERTNPLTLELILPLLQLIRRTHTKQLAEHAYDVLHQFCSKCKGFHGPEISSSAIPATRKLLNAVHDEAFFDTSHAHSAAASQLSILLVKTLHVAQVPIAEMVQVYAATRTRELVAKLAGGRCGVQPGFFTDWNNWCASLGARR